MAKIILEGYIVVPKNELINVLNQLEMHKQLTLEEQGCLVFEVTQHPNDPTRFDVYEEFVDKTAFNSHQKRVAASNWGAATQNVQRFYQLRE
ncbi:putative quinol monooxygenase [Vibrio sp. MA40-2]|uniref:putative quinol monooxygenase n=1 Tax=Vibrio sp. MA40-2 TaxID=3391828 RepID=UPI0039A70F52